MQRVLTEPGGSRPVGSLGAKGPSAVHNWTFPFSLWGWRELQASDFRWTGTPVQGMYMSHESSGAESRDHLLRTSVWRTNLSYHIPEVGSLVSPKCKHPTPRSQGNSGAAYLNLPKSLSMLGPWAAVCLCVSETRQRGTPQPTGKLRTSHHMEAANQPPGASPADPNPAPFSQDV